jgi:hypothetical protein
MHPYLPPHPPTPAASVLSLPERGEGKRELAANKLPSRDIFTARIAPSRFVVVRSGGEGYHEGGGI